MVSREIKFRGWNKQSHIMVDNIQLFTPKDTFNLNEAFDHEYIVLPLQFTGLFDRLGVEIYEGDIVTLNHPYKERTWTGEIIYDDYQFLGTDFYMTHFDNPGDLFSEGTDYIEVIGNIYENGELLK